MKPPRSVGQAARRVMTDLLRQQTVRPQRDEAEATAALVRDMAVAWEAGQLPLEEVRRLSSGLERFQAVGMTSRTDPAWRPLMHLLDALIAEDDRRHGVMQTKHGAVSTREVVESGAKIIGGNLLAFPIAWPWRRKPDPDRDDPGVRDEPVFRQPTPIRSKGEDDLSWFAKGDDDG